MGISVHHGLLQLVKDVVKQFHHSSSYVFLSKTIQANVIKYNLPAINPLDAAKHKLFIPKEYRLSNEKNNQRGNIHINSDLTRRNSELLAALRVEAKNKDKVHKVWTTLNGKIMYASVPEHKNHELSISEKLNLNSFKIKLVNDFLKLSSYIENFTLVLSIAPFCTLCLNM